MDLGGLQRLVDGERWQDRGKPFREHRFSGAGRSDQDQVVASCSGDLEGSLDVLLPFHIRDIHRITAAAVGELSFDVHHRGLNARPTVEQVHHIAQMLHAVHGKSSDDRGFAGIRGRQDHTFEALAFRFQRDGQGTFDRTDTTVE